MECFWCGCSDKLLFKGEHCGNIIQLCLDCKKKLIPETEAETEAEKCYVVKWRLCDENGNEWIEEHVEMTLADFEVLYGANTHEIIWCKIRKKNRAEI